MGEGEFRLDLIENLFLSNKRNVQNYNHTIPLATLPSPMEKGMRDEAQKKVPQLLAGLLRCVFM